MEKRVTIHHQVNDLRIIRAALRFSQQSKERPLTFDQDIQAGELVKQITAALSSR